MYRTARHGHDAIRKKMEDNDCIWKEVNPSYCAPLLSSIIEQASTDNFTKRLAGSTLKNLWGHVQVVLQISCFFPRPPRRDCKHCTRLHHFQNAH